MERMFCALPAASKDQFFQWIDDNLPRPLTWHQVEESKAEYVCDWVVWMDSALTQNIPAYMPVIEDHDYKNFMAAPRKERTMEWFVHIVGPLLERHVEPVYHTVLGWYRDHSDSESD